MGYHKLAQHATAERGGWKQSLAAVLVTTFVSFAALVRGDVVEMSNGDHYSGTVLAVNLTNITLRSEIQGTVTLPRVKVASIVFGSVKPAVPSAQSKGPAVQRTIPAFRQVGSTNAAMSTNTAVSSNLIGQIQDQLLAGAGPEAQSKYSQMVASYLSGKLSVADLRKEAQRTLSAVEEAKKDAGPEMDEALEGYLNILRAFVEQSGQQ